MGYLIKTEVINAIKENMETVCMCYQECENSRDIVRFCYESIEKEIDRLPQYRLENVIETEKGILNKHIYSNGGFMPDQIELFEKIEKALGYKLFRWQKTFLIVGSFRQYGETTARILRDLLAVEKQPLDLSSPKNVIERLNREYYRDIQEKLSIAGIPTRTVLYSKRDVRHYGKEIKVAVIDEISGRQQ